MWVCANVPKSDEAESRIIDMINSIDFGRNARLVFVISSVLGGTHYPISQQDFGSHIVVIVHEKKAVKPAFWWPLMATGNRHKAFGPFQVLEPLHGGVTLTCIETPHVKQLLLFGSVRQAGLVTFTTLAKSLGNGHILFVPQSAHAAPALLWNEIMAVNYLTHFDKSHPSDNSAGNYHI